MKTYLDGRIVDFGDFVHLVDGKVICFEPGVYDLSDERQLEYLFNLADALYVSKLYPNYFGRDNVCVVSKWPGTGEYDVDTHNYVDGFPDNIKSRIREAMRYAGI